MATTLETETRPVPGPHITADYDKRLMVTAGRASQELGAKIAERLNLDLTDAGLKTFSDGEVYCRYEDSIRGADLFIVQSICGSEREGLTVNDALMELLLMVHAAKHASAHRIIAVTPWYGYSRQDKKSAPREPISARLVAEVLETAGIDRLVTMDLHAGQVQGFFSKPVDHMTAMPILTQFVSDRLADDRPRDHRPGRRPREARAHVRPEGRSALRPAGEGAPRAGRRRDRPRDRRRQGQGRGDRRRHHRHRRHAERGGPDRARRGCGQGVRGRHPRRLLRQRVRDARRPRRSRASSSPTRCRCATGRRR